MSIPIDTGTGAALYASQAIGANNPPHDQTPFDAIKVHIEDLYEEAKNWADGAAIESQEQADAVQTLMRQVQEAAKAADDERKRENIPFDQGKVAVQAKYADLISDTKAVRGKTVLAIDALKRALTPWLQKLEAARQAEAKRLRDEAEAAANAARAAAQAAQATNDLQATEDAEEAFKAAQGAERDARRVEVERPKAVGYGRAASLRDDWKITGFAPIKSDDGTVTAGEVALLRHYYSRNRQAMVEAALVLARTDVLNGVRSIPGLVIVNEPKVV